MSALKRPKGRLGAVLSFVGISAIAGVLAGVAVTPAIALTGLAANNSIGMFENLPSYVKIGDLPEKTTIYAHRSVDGADQNVPIASFYAENRESVAWEQVSQFAKDAALAAEDPRYYEHGGIDPLGVVRAAVSNVLGSDVQGASTITQQYVKNVLVAQATGLATEAERDAAYEEATKVSLDRKLKEMRLAIGLEKVYSKDEILLGYLNIALFGGRVYGIQTASQYYYGVNASDLTLPQAASLLAIVNNPEKFRLDKPDNEENGAANGYAANKVRRDYILGNMLEEKKITQEEHDAAVAAPIEPRITPAASGCTMAGNAGFFCDYVVNVIRNDPVFGDSAEERYSRFIRGGFDVYTTLDLDLQDTAQAAIDKNVPKAMETVDIGSASTAVEAGTGKIKVMAQNKDFNDSGDAATLGPNFSALNFNTDAAYGGSQGFQAASTYKAFTLIAWLRAGHTLGETFNVSEKTYDLSTFKACDNSFGGTEYIENDANEGGSRSVLSSTATSINGAFMQMGQKLDQCDIRKAAEDLLVHPAAGDKLEDNPAAILGTNNVSPLTMATAYAGIANNGLVCTPIAIERMVAQDGSDTAIPTSTCTQGIEPDVANAAAYALQRVITEGSGTESNPRDGIEHIAKTGTSNSATQTWTTGASTKMGLAVWVGNLTGDANLRKVRMDNGYYAATARHRIWKPIMTALDEKFGGDDFPDPNSRYIRGVFATVPDVTGMTIDRAQAALENAGFEFVDGGAQPSGAPSGQVIGSDPAGGSSVARGSTITVYTSDGTEVGTAVPDVVGQKAPAATAALQAAGFSEIEYELDTESDADTCTVTGTDPAGGSTAPTDTTVTVSVAAGDEGDGDGEDFDLSRCA
ncbi:transglycosylase domain-containing protein [Naasia sp. SYSU D00057]|uniref:transglycosylase domain-containing protein n=1 Tax=Naasia sp. SYSU D00057 TaxID=2817380 RepID=UPI001B306EB0|nr:transglycosylase domain-containing protein [Naasia sp. SYSU D00057]